MIMIEVIFSGLCLLHTKDDRREGELLAGIPLNNLIREGIMFEIKNKTIREIALEMPATTRVFEELKIDYCCGGNKNFKEACKTADVSPEVVEERIMSLLENKDTASDHDFGAYVSPAKLIDLIVGKHHQFTTTELERLAPLMDKVVRKHGEMHPELKDVQIAFRELADDLIPHLKKEEVVLFPYIKSLEMGEIGGLAVPRPAFGTVQNPIRMMSMEHDAVGGILKKLRRLTNQFTAPEGACPSYKALYFGLEALEKDLHQHIHLENNILFPLAIEMEVE
jgi:regulator of cell morphogenesis and NO signaling